MTWTNLLYKEADQRVLPQAFDILGIGINKHKTNMTGKIEWTGITRHVRADFDPFFALANLMAHEIEVQNFRFIARREPEPLKYGLLAYNIEL